jgi:multidrug efflux system membrane fusion protein
VLTSLLVLLAMVSWLLSGVLSENGQDRGAATPIAEQTQAKNLFTVVVQPLEAKPYLNTVTIQARSEADKIVTLAAETNGVISSLPVKKGSAVQKGQNICAIDVCAASNLMRPVGCTKKGMSRKANWQPLKPPMTAQMRR